MISAGVLVLGVAVVFLAIFFGLGQRWARHTIFVRLSWIPSIALLLQGVFYAPLARRLSYAVIVLPVLTCFSSLALTVVGVVLVASARARGGPVADLRAATLVASIPVALLAAYLVYALVVGGRN